MAEVAHAAHAFRPGFEFDAETLERHLLERGVIARGPLLVRQLPGGQSNPTYRVDTPDGPLLLRRKPPGPLLPSAHAVDREFRVTQALAVATDVPVARPLHYCADADVVGTPFFVATWVDGRIYWDPALPECARAERAALLNALVAALASLHCVDPVRVGLADYGRPEGYLARQTERWARQYAADGEAGRVPAMERLVDWLRRHLPSDLPPATITHGDYRIDNVIFAPDAPRVLAVLDWELSTLGDPLADFAYHLMMYRLPTLAIPGLAGRDLDALGLPREDEYVARYCELTGRRGFPHREFYLAFALYRLAGIFHGIRGRVVRGTAVSPKAQEYARHVEAIAEAGWRIARDHG